MPRYDYARSGNPTRDFLEQQIAQLEQGTRGFAFASGLAAIHAVLSIFKPGDRIIVGDNIYGGSYSQLNGCYPLGRRGRVSQYPGHCSVGGRRQGRPRERHRACASRLL